jgi:hypothetical protein
MGGFRPCYACIAQAHRVRLAESYSFANRILTRLIFTVNSYKRSVGINIDGTLNHVASITVVAILLVN